MSEPELPREILEAYRPPAPPADLTDRVMAAVSAPPRARSSRRRWPLVVAAGLAVAAAGVAGWWARGGGGRRGAVVVTQDRGTSTYDVEPGTELDVVTPVARARALGTRFRVEVETMDRSKLKKGAVGAALVTAAVVIVYEGHVLLSNERGEVDVGPGQSARAEADRAPAPLARAHRVAAPVPTPAAPVRPRKLAARERMALRTAIDKARAARAARSGGSAAPRPVPSLSPADSSGNVDKEYIRDRVHEVLPLLKECYMLALDDAPKLAGRLVVSFTIEGDPDVGGLIDDVGFDDDAGTMPANDSMRECMRETMLSIEIDPPPNGGQVLVHYPFLFRNDPD